MGHLRTLNEVKEKAIWYFEDAYHDTSARRYIFKWPSDNYPETVAIHNDEINNRLRIRIREWIEDTLSETVITSSVDKSYQRFTDSEKRWEHSYQITNIWTVFYFKSKEAATMFSLKFSEYVKPITDEHPKWI